MTDQELINTIGGASTPSASFLNAIARSITAIYDLGRAFGTAIRMLVTKSRC